VTATPAQIDASGNISNLGTVSGTAITGTSLAISAPTSPPSSTGQGLVTILVRNTSSSISTGNLACWDGSTATARTCPHGSTTGVIGVVYGTSTVGSYTYSQVVRMGSAACIFDNTATTNHYVVVSSSTDGECSDSGSSSYPAASQPVGIAAAGGTGTQYVFTMNDMPTPSSAVAGLATGNTWTAGTQSFASASSLIVPYSGLAAPTGIGSIASDSSTVGRYAMGWSGTYVSGLTLIPTTSPEGVGATASGQDAICAKGGDSSITGLICYNGTGTDGTSPTAFQQYINVPEGFFSIKGRSIRVTYYLLADSSATSIPTLTFSLVWQPPTTSSPILFQGAAALPPASLSNQRFTISCLITGTGSASSGTKLYADCTSSSLGTTTVGSSPAYTISIPAIPANTVTALPTNVDTSDASEKLSLEIQYSGNKSGNAVALLNVIPKFVE